MTCQLTPDEDGGSVGRRGGWGLKERMQNGHIAWGYGSAESILLQCYMDRRKKSQLFVGLEYIISVLDALRPSAVVVNSLGQLQY